MAFWKRKAKEPEQRNENPNYPATSLLSFDYSGVPGSALVTIDAALGVPSVWGAVNYISNVLAGLPLHVFRKTDEGTEKAPNDPLYSILHDAPNSELTSYDWRKYMMWQVLTRGRGLTFIDRAENGRITGLFPMNPLRTEVRADGFRKLYVFTEQNGARKTYTSDEVIDICFAVEPDMLNHISPIFRNRGAIALAIALQDYAQKLFLNGGVPPLSLQGPFQSPEAVARASADVTKAIQKAAKEGKQVLAMPVGHTLEKLGISPEDGQLVEARLFSLQEVARIYGLPPIFLQDLSHGTFSNTEQQDLHAVKHLIGLWAEKLEQQLNLKLFGSRNNRFAKFNLDGFQRGDFKTRTEGIAKGVQNSLLTPNEGRELDDRPPLPGGDELVIQQNMTPLGSTENLDNENGV